MTVSHQTVVTCNHAECPNQVSTDTVLADGDVPAWLDSCGWVQFKAKSSGDSSILNFCPDHLVVLRLFFGSLDAADGLVLSQQGSA